MSNRRLVTGDSVVIRPEAIDALQREGYRDARAHVPAAIVDDWAGSIDRRVLRLDIDCKHVSGSRYTTVYPSQVRLATGRAEKERLAAEARAARWIKAAADRQAARRIPKKRRTKRP